MTKTIQASIVIFLLISATLVSYYVSDHQMPSGTRSLTIVSLASLKFFLISWFFLDLKNSHKLWKFMGFFYIALFALISL